MLAERNAPWAFFSVRAKPAEETAFLMSPPPAMAVMAGCILAPPPPPAMPCIMAASPPPPPPPPGAAGAAGFWLPDEDAFERPNLRATAFLASSAYSEKSPSSKKSMARRARTHACALFCPTPCVLLVIASLFGKTI